MRTEQQSNGCLFILSLNSIVEVVEMESWQWLLIGLIIFLVTAAGIFIVFSAFAGHAPEAGANIFQQFLDALFGWFG